MAKFIAIDEVAIKNMTSWNKENPGAVPLVWPSLNPLLPVMVLVLFPGMIRQYHNQMMFILEKRERGNVIGTESICTQFSRKERNVEISIESILSEW